MIDPGTIMGAVGGLAGLFGGGPRMTATQRLALEEAKKRSRLADLMEKYAMGYDPEREMRDSVEHAEKSAARSLEISTADLNRRFLADGGNPKGDTAFGLLRRRNQDDILNSLSSFTAEQRSQYFQKKMSALMSAFGARAGGAEQYMQLASMMPQANYGSSMQMLLQALGQIPGLNGGGGMMSQQEAMRRAQGLVSTI